MIKIEEKNISKKHLKKSGTNKALSIYYVTLFFDLLDPLPPPIVTGRNKSMTPSYPLRNKKV